MECSCVVANYKRVKFCYACEEGIKVVLGNNKVLMLETIHGVCCVS